MWPLPQNCAKEDKEVGHLSALCHPPAPGMNFVALHGCAGPLRETGQAETRGRALGVRPEDVLTTAGELGVLEGYGMGQPQHLLCLQIP